MDAKLLQNGVLTGMSVRYPDFSIEQDLQALMANPRPDCSKPDSKAPVRKEGKS